MTEPTSSRLRACYVGQQNAWTEPLASDKTLDINNVSFSRFTNSDSAAREVQLETNVDYYRISVTLRGSRVLAHYNGRPAYDGKTTPGMVHIAEPNTSLSGVLGSPGEALHLFIPTRVLLQFGEEEGLSGICLRKTIFQMDHSIGFMAGAIANDMLDKDAASRLYVDSLCTAAVAKLLCRFSNREKKISTRSNGLSGWRLKKVCEYVDAFLDHPITLQELANTAGLSRMHFASQFRQTCGLPPHQYVLQQRIERSKAMLRHSQLSVLQVALAVGFESTSHYSTVFKRIVGRTPSEWRR